MTCHGSRRSCREEAAGSRSWPPANESRLFRVTRPPGRTQTLPLAIYQAIVVETLRRSFMRIYAWIAATMASLDDGAMWPVAFAVTALTPAEEEKVAALVKKAVS